MERRIFGLENEYGITCTASGQRRLSPDEVARYLFRRVVSWGRSSNVFLRNGSRLYLDVGSHPEYATPECDSVVDAVTHDKAGERIVDSLARDAGARLADEGIDGEIFLFKNNTDSAGNSYGCHENYLITREVDFGRLAEVLIPFLVTRQVLAGAGKVLQGPRGAFFALSQRADHMWEGVSSATTRSRPIINTRDEPHSDAERYRRLHVIVGDSNLNESASLFKLGSVDLLLRMVEAGATIRDMSLDNPIRAIRDVSHDMTGTRRIRLSAGRELSALEIQRAYLERVSDWLASRSPTPTDKRVLDLWSTGLDALEVGDITTLARTCDWAAKYRLIERVCARDDLALGSAKVLQIDLAYHDVNRARGLYYLLERRGQVDRETTDEAIEAARENPPASTRAALRGAFIAAAQDQGRDVTVDWVHLKLNDQAQRTVLCKDPFRSVDARVESLIASMSR